MHFDSTDRGFLIVSVGIGAAIVVLIAILLFVPVVHHVGDTRYCTGTGTGIDAKGGVSVVTVHVPCGVYRSGDPDVTP